jgi:hypothetical protein
MPYLAENPARVRRRHLCVGARDSSKGLTSVGTMPSNARTRTNSSPAGLDLDFFERFERTLQESPPVFPILSVNVIMLKAEGLEKCGNFSRAQMPLAKDRVDDPVSGLLAVKPPVRGDRGQPL